MRLLLRRSRRRPISNRAASSLHQINAVIPSGAAQYFRLPRAKPRRACGDCTLPVPSNAEGGRAVEESLFDVRTNPGRQLKAQFCATTRCHSERSLRSEESAFELWTKEELLNNQPQKLLLPSANQKFRGLGKIKFLAKILDGRFVDLNALLLDEPLRFALRRRKLQLNEQRDQLLCRAARNPVHGNFCRRFAIAEDSLEILGRLFPGARAVEIGDNFLAEPHLRIHRMQLAGRNICLERSDLFGRAVGNEFVVAPHEIVGNGHHLPENLRRRFRDANVIAEALGHFFRAVEPDENRHGDADFPFEAIFALDVAMHEQGEFLLRRSDLYVGFERHSIVGSEEGIEKFVYGNRLCWRGCLWQRCRTEHSTSLHIRHGSRTLDFCSWSLRLQSFSS